MSVSRPYLIILFLILQSIFWYGIHIGETTLWKGSRAIKPNLDIVPVVDSEAMVKAISFGDNQFYFRAMGYEIQNAGDSFGRTTPLKNYDYSELYKWLVLLDKLDPVSDYLPSMASYYYGATQNPKAHLPYIVDYLENHADKMPGKKWWWYTQAIYHAKHKLNDLERALEISEKLSDIPKDIKIPLWARQMRAFILEQKGEYKQACEIILNILDTYEEVSEGELNFMLYFIKDRVKAMELSGDEKIDPRCQQLYESNMKKHSKN